MKTGKYNSIHRTFHPEYVHNLFSSRIRNTRYIPGRESSDNREERQRAQELFLTIDDYCEQA